MIDYSVLLACSGGNADKELNRLNMLRDRQLDGLIIAPSATDKNLHLFSGLKDSGSPFVLVDRHIHSLNCDYVTADNYSGGYKAARHFVSLGREKFAFASTVGKGRNATSVQERLEGFTVGLLESGLDLQAQIGLETLDVMPQEEFSRQAIRGFLKQKVDIDAIFATNDAIALGIRNGLFEAGIIVPNKTGLIGFDDSEIAPFVNPPLTTLNQQCYVIGKIATSLLFEKINGEVPVHESRHVLLEPELIVRQSCGANL